MFISKQENITPEGDSKSDTEGANRLELARFFPYQLSVLNASVSEVVAQLYRGRFQLAAHEWRVLAALGESDDGSNSAKVIAAVTSMEKMQVSRAISGLKKAGLISRTVNKNDRRSSCLALTATGKEVYTQIVPLVLAREAYLLSALSQDEIAQLTMIFDKLAAQANALKQLG